MTQYVITAGDCNSDDYTEDLFPNATLISLRMADNGDAMFDKFSEMVELGDDVIMITSTTPLHFNERSKGILSKYFVDDYLGHLDYTLMTNNKDIEYGTSFEGRSLGGISPLVGKVAAALVKAGSYIQFREPEVSSAAAINGEIDLVSKPSRNGKLDTEGGMHLACDLTKEFGLRLQYYVISPKNNNNVESTNIFNKERQDLAKYAHILAA